MKQYVVFTIPPDATVTLTPDTQATLTPVDGVLGGRPAHIFTIPDSTHDGWGAERVVSKPGFGTITERGILWLTRPGQYAEFAVDDVTLSPKQAARSPLVMPVCKSCPSPYSYDKVLPWPNGKAPQSRDYLRANFWGIPIAGLPFIPGGSREHPERYISYLAEFYPDRFRATWAAAALSRGYTHDLASWPDARSRAGYWLPTFVESCKVRKARMPYLHVKLGSKDFDPPNQNLAQWRNALDPVMDDLAGIADEYSFWEYNLFNTSGQVALDIHQYFGDKAHAQGASFWCHFSEHVPFWDDRGDAYWWNTLRGHVDGLDYQGQLQWPWWKDSAAWDIGDLQARSVDILNLFAQTGHKLRQFEPGTPALMFSGDRPDEGEGDAIGYLSACTKAATPPYGFGAGARMPDGTAV